MSADTSELDRLIKDVEGIPAEIQPQMRDIVGNSLNAIQRDWRARWHGHDEIKHLPRAITIEIHEEPGVVTGEVGPDKHLPQGRLGSFIELGTRTSGPIPGGFPALVAEEPRFVRAVEEIKILGV